MKSTRAREDRWPWCTDERLLALAALLEAGIPVVTACAKLGIPRQSLKVARAEDEGVSRIVDDALASFEEECLRKILAAAEDVAGPKGTSRGDWKALSWLLEKRFPKRYGKVERREVTGAGGGPQKVEIVVGIDDAVAGAKGEEP